MDIKNDVTLSKEEAKKIKKSLYHKEYYKRTKDINKEEKLKRQIELNKNYKNKYPEKLKVYREKYYQQNKHMFIKPKTCECCNYTSTASNIARHNKTKKHLKNLSTFSKPL